MALGTMGAVRLPVDQQPTPGPLRYGLFTVAPPRQIFAPDGDPNLPEHAFGGGLYYYPQGCGTAHAYPVVCDNPPPSKEPFDPDTAEVLVLPFLVYATIVCGPRGNTTAYLTSKTGSRLFSSEQHAVEFALMTGGGAGVGAAPRIDDPAGPYGAPVDVGAGGTFADIVDAVSALEGYAYNTFPYGHHAVLHAQSAAAAYAQEAHLVHTAADFGGVWGVPGVTLPDGAAEVSRMDPVLRTALGTKWVFGGGYPGTGVDGAAPGAGESYIWITGNVSVWRSSIWSPPDPMQVFDRSLNQLKMLAERPYLATFDCFHAYALVDLPNPAV
jgi:hypothetical protein